MLRHARAVSGVRRRRLFEVVAMATLVGFLEAAVLYLMARGALAATTGEDRLQVPIAGDVSIVSTMVATAVLVTVSAGASLVLARLASRISEATLLLLRRSLLDAYLSTTPEVRSTDSEGEFQEIAMEYSQRSERFVSQAMTVVSAGTAGGILIVAAVATSPVVTGMFALMLGAIGLLLRPLTDRVHQGAEVYSARNRRLSARIAQTARLAPVIDTFGVKADVEAWIDGNVRASATAARRMRFGMQLQPTLYQSAAILTVTAIIGIGVGTSASYLDKIGPVLFFAVRSIGYAKQFQISRQATSELWPYPSIIVSALARLRETPREHGTRDLPPGGGDLRISDLSYRYPTGPWVLQDLNLHVGSGRVVGIVGRSGAGKSTLVQLLLGNRSPTKGSVTYASVPLEELTAEALAKAITLVPQDNQLLAGTVYDNIRFFRQGLDEDALTAAADGAHIRPEIEAMPSGFETEIGPGAADLSGGQKQRIGIARSLAGQPAVLVLDEPTSSLDAQAAAAVQTTLEGLRGKVSIVLITHRASALEICDEVWRLDEGRLVLVSKDGQRSSPDLEAR
jgi:ATP-binding cassette subfamily B protein